jgi:hypothetical protein
MADPRTYLFERKYTLADVAFLGDVPEKSVRNWMNRGTIDIGKRTGSSRWYFHLLDALMIRVVGDLTVRLPLNPEHSAPIAFAVANAVMENAVDDCDRDKHGKLVRQSNTNIIVGFNDDGSLLAYRVDSGDIDRKYPPKLDNATDAPLRRAHLIIPASATFRDVLFRTEKLERFRAQHVEEVEN